jgi:transcription elongation factor GreA
MIQKSQLIDPALLPHAKVSFGSTVKILNINTDEEEVYTLCGVLESEPQNGLISIHSPLARAMLGKGVEDEFTIALPHAEKEYEILTIEYKNIFSLKKNIRTKKDFSFH